MITGRTTIGTLATSQSCGPRDESAKAEDGELYQSCSCARINRQVNPWWSVRLKGMYTVTDVYINNRDDHGGKQ